MRHPRQRVHIAPFRPCRGLPETWVAGQNYHSQAELSTLPIRVKEVCCQRDRIRTCDLMPVQSVTAASRSTPDLIVAEILDDWWLCKETGFEPGRPPICCVAVMF